MFKTFISSDEKSCILNCIKEYEYFDNIIGNSNNWDDYASNDDKIWLDSCIRIIQLINNVMLNKLCANENLWLLYKQFINSNNIYFIKKSS